MNGSYTTYGYDNDGQLISSLGYTSGGAPVGAEQVGFGYDAGWNVTNRTVNGWPGGYQVNDLNELTGLYVVDYYGNEIPAYDANGNLVSMNVDYAAFLYSYFYDDENRLIGVTCSQSGYPLGWSDPPQSAYDWKTEFDYDGLGRLRQRIEYTTDYYGYNWVTATTRYIYDGMRVVRERSDGNVPQVSYTRGSDGFDVWYGDSGVTCTRVPGSAGREDSAMRCCRDNANSGIWFPGVNDCHNPLQDCMERAGFPPSQIPRHPRFGPNNGIQ